MLLSAKRKAENALYGVRALNVKNKTTELDEESTTQEYGYTNSLGKFVKLDRERYEKTRRYSMWFDILMGMIALFLCVAMFYGMFKQAANDKQPYFFEDDVKAVSSLVGFTLLYTFALVGIAVFGYKYTQDGEGQLDSLISEVVLLIAIMIVAVSVMCKWIIMGKKDIDARAMAEVQNHFTIFTAVYSTIIMILCIKNVIRKRSVYRPLIHHQNWQQPAPTGDLVHSALNKHFIAAPLSRWIILLAGITFVVTYNIVCSLYVKSRMIGDPWNFNTIYELFLYTIGLMLIIKCIAYCVWNWLARNFDSIYRIHYNSFFYFTLAPAVIIILGLVSYRHNFRDVVLVKGITDRQFETLKESVLERTSYIMLVSIPTVWFGFTKLLELFSNLAPDKTIGPIKSANDITTREYRKPETPGEPNFTAG